MRRHLVVASVVAIVAMFLGVLVSPANADGPVDPGSGGGGATLSPSDGELLYSPEGNRLRRYLTSSIGTADPRDDVLIPSSDDAPGTGRDINGQVCFFPDGSGRFIAGADTGQTAIPPGWGVFDAAGTQIGKLTATYYEPQGDPYSCAFGPDGTLFTSEIGNESFTGGSGQLLEWFPPYDRFPGAPGTYPNADVSTNYCKLATGLQVPGQLAVAKNGDLYLTMSNGFRVDRFRGPFPTSNDAAGGCGRTDALGDPLADSIQRDTVITSNLFLGMLTFSGITFAPNGNFYVSSVFTGRIAEYTMAGRFVRFIVLPRQYATPVDYGTPQGLAVGADGTLYYADLDVVARSLDDIGPGSNGKVWRVRMVGGRPQRPEIIKSGLAFPDAVAVLPRQEPPDTTPRSESRSFGGGPARTFTNNDEKWLNPDTAAQITEKWRYRTDSIVTASPAVAIVDLPGKPDTQVAYFPAWDNRIHAVEARTGKRVWAFDADDQPGASYVGAASAHVERVGSRDLVLVGYGETAYALDAVTGEEVWRFAAGTGCRDENGDPPGLCSFKGERNEIESSMTVTDNGTVVFGMDHNEITTGKGGVYGLDIADGRMRWFFDLESGATCRPDAGDDIRKYDGFHSESELGLPDGFFATREGCNAPRDTTGCGAVWSSPAYDTKSDNLFLASSNCNTDDDPTTGRPPAPMPPYDEALFSLTQDGAPLWKWRPREVDNDDLAFGATPNLFSIRGAGGAMVEVVGIGSKDGTYYVLPRTGGTPIWQTRVVAGDAYGGIIGTPAADEVNRRIHIGTAAGADTFRPQRPTVHTLDMDTGAIIWQNSNKNDVWDGDAAFSPSLVANGVFITGSSIWSRLRLWDAARGGVVGWRFVGEQAFGSVASGAVVVDGMIIVGSGIGQRADPNSKELTDVLALATARLRSAVVGYCTPGAPDC